ncbi:MAG: hypothetical protein J7621_19025, partial [Niastella sp.]|nr:hypothetical protein [Niastella sp.]
MAEKQALLQKILEIESEVDSAVSRRMLHANNLAAGNPGAVMFYFYLSKLTGSEEYFDKATRLYERIVNDYRFDPKYYSHCSGLAGLNWLTGHLIKNDFIDASCYEAISETEHFLYEKMTELLKQGFYDFLHDGLSIFYFFIENDIQHYDKEKIIAEVVDLLANIATTNEDGTVLWYNVDFVNRVIESNECNLGLAHGMPSIISLLSKAALRTNNPETRERAIMLADKAARFILTLQSKDPSTLSLYPFGMKKNNDASYNSRLAWCYGDLGIAISFWHLYEASNDENWKNASLQIIDKASLRRDRTQNMLHDAAVCHGTSGVSHIFHRFYLHTNNERYQQAAKYWIGH